MTIYLDRKAFNANLLVVHWSEHMIDHKKIYLIQKCPCLSNQTHKKKKKTIRVECKE